MSKEATKKLVEDYFSAFNQADKAAMLQCVSEDIRHDVNQGGVRVGKDLFSEFYDHMQRCYQENLTDMVVMVSEDGSRASAEFIVNGTYLNDDEGLPQANKQTYKLPAGTFFAVENDKISRVTTYYNLEDWIAQVNQ